MDLLSFCLLRVPRLETQAPRTIEKIQLLLIKVSKVQKTTTVDDDAADPEAAAVVVPVIHTVRIMRNLCVSRMVFSGIITRNAE